jgi:tripartite-type tricarboxylate transporter receptor subunit TctC
MKRVLIATICCTAPLLPLTASADAVSDFYKGNTITIITATGAGSAYGLHGRLLADAIRKNIPGNPKIVMQFMPGGGGAKQANHLYNVAPKNGTVIGFPLKYIAVNQMMGRKGLKYDAGKFNYLGSLGPVNSVVAILKDKAPAYTMEDVKKTAVILGSTGKSSETFITPTLMNNLLGTKFKIVTGYRGMKGVNLAIERGEVHGRAGSWDSLKSGQPEWLDKNRVSLIALSGLTRNWDLRNVPTLLELAKTDEQKSVLEFFGSGNAVGWLFVTPPSVPASRVAALRKAFDTTMADPAYVAKVRARKLDIQAKTGAEVDTIIRKTLSASPALIQRIKSAMAVK